MDLPSAEERSALIHDLDMQHQHSLHNTELIHRDEEARLLQLRALSLRDEIALLDDKLTQRDARIGSLTRRSDKTRMELDDNEAQIRYRDTQLKKQAVELANLRAEVDSLNASMQDSAKILQEKFALTRELERLRPEMEHLRSQLTNYQAMIAEKHDLQRQLDSLEVELENEKRSKPRSPSKDVDRIISDLKSKLETAEEKLAADQKERDKTAMEHERQLGEAHSHGERLEERISALKVKLKGVQNELKETQSELQTCRAQLQEAQAGSQRTGDRTKGAVTTKSRPNGKRHAPELGADDMAIPTPGNDDVVKKRPGRKRAADHALLGEKSLFSITPFLNRTKSLADDSVEEVSYLASAVGGQEAELEEQHDEPSPVQTADEPPTPEPVPKAASKPPKPRGRPRMKPLSEPAVSEKQRAVPPAKKSAGRKQQPTLDEVVEEPLLERQDDTGASATAQAKRSGLQAREMEAPRVAANNSMLDMDGKKKKRKLLGGVNKTIFEDEDEEPPQRPAKLQLGANRRLKAPLGGAVNAFAAGKTFSPLKRDRRGVNASFLS